MESLLQRIVDTGAEIAILDITGVPTVDTQVAQHLIKTVTAARLMGADCIISGIRPQIAQTIVHLGVDLQGVITKATLADAFAIAIRRKGLRVVKREAGVGVGSRGRASGPADRRTRLTVTAFHPTHNPRLPTPDLLLPRPSWNASRSSAWARSCWSPSRSTCTTGWP
jgi:anti-anti-sigma regulatory factor